MNNRDFLSPLAKHPQLSAACAAAKNLAHAICLLSSAKSVIDSYPGLGPCPSQASDDDEWGLFAQWFGFVWVGRRCCVNAASSIDPVRHLLAATSSSTFEILGFCRPSLCEALLDAFTFLSNWPAADNVRLGRAVELADALLQDSGDDSGNNLEDAFNLVAFAAESDNFAEGLLDALRNVFHHQPIAGETPDETCSRYRRARDRLRACRELNQIISAINWPPIFRRVSKKKLLREDRLQAQLDIEFTRAAMNERSGQEACVGSAQLPNDPDCRPTVFPDQQPAASAPTGGMWQPAANSSNTPPWSELGDAKRAILEVLSKSNERLQNRAIAKKAGYSEGTLRHHYGELQSWGYIDKTSDGYAITQKGAALVPKDPV